MLITYPALFFYDKADKIPFLITFPNFPDKITQGDSTEDAMLMAKDLLTIILADYVKNHISLPKAYELKDISLAKNNPLGKGFRFDHEKSFIKTVEVDLDDQSFKP